MWAGAPGHDGAQDEGHAARDPNPKPNPKPDPSPNPNPDPNQVADGVRSKSAAGTFDLGYPVSSLPRHAGLTLTVLTLTPTPNPNPNP